MLIRLAIIGFYCVLVAFAGHAETFEVRMLNKGKSGKMVFEPDFVLAAIGDTVTFLPSDKGHNVESIKGMIPTNVKKFKSKFNKEFSINLEKEGLYGVKCTPHYTMGMIALIQVGNALNFEKVISVRQRGKAKKRFDLLFEKIKN